MSTSMTGLCQQMQGLSVTSALEIAGGANANRVNAGVLETFLQPSGESRIQNLTALKGLLKKACFVYTIMHEAIASLRQRRLTDFDALVGDRACQIRALFVARFATAYFSSPSMHTELCALQRTLMRKIRVMQRELERTDTLRQSVTTASVLEPLEIEVPERLIHMAMAYLLTKTKEKGETSSECPQCATQVTHCYKEHTNYELANLASIGMTRTQICVIVDAIKIQMSRISCTYVAQEAAELSSELTLPVLEMLSGAHLYTSSNGRCEVPFFATVAVVFQSVIRHNLPVLIKVRRAVHNVVCTQDVYDEVFCLKPVEGELRRVVPTNEDMNKPCIVIEAQRNAALLEGETVEQYRTRLTQANMMDVILMNAAHHPQYTDRSAELSGTELERAPLRALSSRAEQEGCCQENQRLFCISHIFADTLANQCQ